MDGIVKYPGHLPRIPSRHFRLGVTADLWVPARAAAGHPRVHTLSHSVDAAAREHSESSDVKRPPYSKRSRIV